MANSIAPHDAVGNIRAVNKMILDCGSVLNNFKKKHGSAIADKVDLQQAISSFENVLKDNSTKIQVIAQQFHDVAEVKHVQSQQELLPQSAPQTSRLSNEKTEKKEKPWQWVELPKGKPGHTGHIRNRSRSVSISESRLPPTKIITPTFEARPDVIVHELGAKLLKQFEKWQRQSGGLLVALDDQRPAERLYSDVCARLDDIYRIIGAFQATIPAKLEHRVELSAVTPDMWSDYSGYPAGQWTHYLTTLLTKSTDWAKRVEGQLAIINADGSSDEDKQNARKEITHLRKLMDRIDRVIAEIEYDADSQQAPGLWEEHTQIATAQQVIQNLNVTDLKIFRENYRKIREHDESVANKSSLLEEKAKPKTLPKKVVLPPPVKQQSEEIELTEAQKIWLDVDKASVGNDGLSKYFNADSLELRTAAQLPVKLTDPPSITRAENELATARTVIKKAERYLENPSQDQADEGVNANIRTELPRLKQYEYRVARRLEVIYQREADNRYKKGREEALSKTVQQRLLEEKQLSSKAATSPPKELEKLKHLKAEMQQEMEVLIAHLWDGGSIKDSFSADIWINSAMPKIQQKKESAKTTYEAKKEKGTDKDRENRDKRKKAIDNLSAGMECIKAVFTSLGKVEAYVRQNVSVGDNEKLHKIAEQFATYIDEISQQKTAWEREPSRENYKKVLKVITAVEQAAIALKDNHLKSLGEGLKLAQAEQEEYEKSKKIPVSSQPPQRLRALSEGGVASLPSHSVSSFFAHPKQLDNKQIAPTATDSATASASHSGSDASVASSSSSSSSSTASTSSTRLPETPSNTKQRQSDTQAGQQTLPDTGQQDQEQEPSPENGEGNNDNLTGKGQ